MPPHSACVADLAGHAPATRAMQKVERAEWCAACASGARPSRRRHPRSLEGATGSRAGVAAPEGLVAPEGLAAQERRGWAGRGGERWRHPVHGEKCPRRHDWPTGPQRWPSLARAGTAARQTWTRPRAAWGRQPAPSATNTTGSPSRKHRRAAHGPGGAGWARARLQLPRSRAYAALGPRRSRRCWGPATKTTHQRPPRLVRLRNLPGQAMNRVSSRRELGAGGEGHTAGAHPKRGAPASLCCPGQGEGRGRPRCFAAGASADREGRGDGPCHSTLRHALLRWHIRARARLAPLPSARQW